MSHGGTGVSRWEALGILMVLGFLNYLDRNLLLPLQSQIAAELHLSNTQIGALSTSFHLVYAFTAPLVGYLSDRFTRKTILILSVTLWSVVTAMSGLSTGFLSLLLWRALTGLGEGGYFPTAISLIGDLFPQRLRGRAIALHGACVTLGGGAGMAVGGALGERFGWRTPFLLVIVPGLALALVLKLRFREPARQPTAGEAKVAPTAARPYLRVIGSAPVALISACACLATFGFQGMTTFLPKYLTDGGAAARSSGLQLGLAFAFTLVGQLSGGWLSDHVAARSPAARPLLVALPYLLVAPLIALATQFTAFMTVALFAVAQIARGFAEPNIYGTLIDTTAAGERGSAQGFLLMTSFAGASASGVVGGALIDGVGYGATMVTFAIAALIAGGLALTLSFRLRRAQADLPAARSR